ncbi:MAG: ATP-binding protein, partial [Burkholderiales bacterium]
MNATPLLLAWSGGKDCLLALQRLLADPRWHVVGLLTTVNRSHQRVAMHGVRQAVLAAQTAALGLPLVEVLLDWPGSNEAYEQAHAEALAQARVRWPGLRHCAFGDLFLQDVRDYRVRQLGRENWRAVFPLWGEDTARLSRHFIS